MVKEGDETLHQTLHRGSCCGSSCCDISLFLCQQHKEQVLAEQELQKQEAINDSLIGKAAEFYKLANEQYLVGEKHDEGYEKH